MMEQEEPFEIADTLKGDFAGIDTMPDAAPSYGDAEQLLTAYFSESGRSLNIEKGSEDYQKLLGFANRAYVEITNRLIDRIEQNGNFRRRDAAFEKITAQSELPSKQLENSMTLGEFLDIDQTNKKDTKSASTVKAVAMPLRVLREVLGEQTKLRDITREHMAEVASVIRAVPLNMVQRYSKLSIKDAIAKGKKDGAPACGKRHLKKGRDHPRHQTPAQFRTMIEDIHRTTGHGIRPICTVLGVPRSSYYHAAVPTPS